MPRPRKRVDSQAPTKTPAPRPGQPAAVADKEPLPRPFGRYTLRKRIGKGGMGIVYLADDTRLDIPVALKIPRPDLLARHGVKRFYREAQAAALLHHPNLCRIFDIGELDGIHYLTMGFIDGRPLAVPAHADGAVVARLFHKL